MNRPAADSPAFWPTVLLLLRFARKRSTGRQKRRAELQRNRAGKFVADWGGFGFVVLALGMTLLHIAAAVAVHRAVVAGEVLEAERSGRVVISHAFAERIREQERIAGNTAALTAIQLERFYRPEARRIAEARGGSVAEIEHRLRQVIGAQGSRGISDEDIAAGGLSDLPRGGA